MSRRSKIRDTTFEEPWVTHLREETMAQQMTQFDALVAALQQTIQAQGETQNPLAEAARSIAEASTRTQTATCSTSGTSGTTFDTGSKVLKGPGRFRPGNVR